jgi:hypothetical protein
VRGTVAEKNNAAELLEGEPPPVHAHLEVSDELEETPENDLKAAAHVEASHSTQPEGKPDASSGQAADSRPLVYSSGAMLPASDRAGQIDFVPPPDPENILFSSLIEVSDERDEPEAGSGVSAEEYSSDGPATSTVAATSPPDINAQGGNAFAETEVVSEAALQAPNDKLPQDSEQVTSSEAGGHQSPAVEIEIAGAAGENALEKAATAAIATPAASNNTQTGNTAPEAEGARGEEVLPSEGAEAPVDNDAEKAPVPYRPPPQRPPRQTGKPVTQSSTCSTSDLALDIRVRLRFDRFDFCEIRLLPERMAEMDSEIEVKTGGTSLHLAAQEEWYEDLLFENIGDRLRRGLELKGLLADHRRARWLLTGRDIYVLASHQRASGFVSTTRLVLGRSHVVLCVAELLQRVEAALNEAGCQGYTKLDEAHGVPSGWVGLRGVAPSRAVPLDPGIDPFYAIKPAPDIEIEIEGGVCLRNSIWLAGFPPRIKLLGDTSGPVKVLIDGKEAIPTGDGSLAVDGYNQPGQHFVYCEGLSCSRSYSIEDPPDVWEEWPAYHFGQAEICGPLVHLLPEATGRRIFSVPMSNPLLLGAEPGQIFRCSSRSVKNWKGFVPFDVVWALPALPYICDKKTARIIQFAQVPLALPQSPKQPVLPWCAAILEASRKGLRIEDGSPEGTVLWKEYKKAARNIWRAAR